MTKAKYLMNPFTGSVDTEENWLAEMKNWETVDGKTPQDQFDSLEEVEEEEGDDEPEPEPYEYHIDLDERGEFYADVRDAAGQTVFEIHGFDIFEDGFMRHKEDMSGLTDYLIDLGVIPVGSEIKYMG